MANETTPRYYITTRDMTVNVIFDSGVQHPFAKLGKTWPTVIGGGHRLRHTTRPHMQHSTSELLIAPDSPLAIGQGFLPAEGSPTQIINRAISGLARNPEIACEILLAATDRLADSPKDVRSLIRRATTELMRQNTRNLMPN